MAGISHSVAPVDKLIVLRSLGQQSMVSWKIMFNLQLFICMDAGSSKAMSNS